MSRLTIGRATWDLAPLFSGDDDSHIEEAKTLARQKTQAFVEKWKSRDDYLRDPAVLKEALDDYEVWQRSYGTDGGVGYYFSLRHAQDENSPAIKAHNNTIDEFSVKLQNEIQFFYLRISKIPKREHGAFLKYPDLSVYRHFLERAFAHGDYVLTEPEEKILNFKQITSHDHWVIMTSGFIAGEERTIMLEDATSAKKNFTECLNLASSQHKDVRSSAARAVNDILAKYADVATEELNAILANKKVNDELRAYTRPDEARHRSDDIESDTVDVMLDRATKRFDVSRRYYALKAKLLGLKQLLYHERNVSYGTIDKRYSFEDAMGLAHKVFSKLDRQFADIFEQFIRNGQIDVYPRKNKGSGAFCAHHFLIHPTYVFLNHTDRLQDVLTLAHEMGHAMNNELMRASRHALDFGSSLATAEVASIFMEDFILEEIMSEADDKLRLALMMMRLNDNVSSVFRQVACYRFEQELHHTFRAKGYLSRNEIGALFQKHMAAYMGDAVEQSPGSENWWVYWSHIRNFFYVYSYCNGLLISKALQASVRKDLTFIIRVKEFLAAGHSNSPKNIFSALGIDITRGQFWDQGLGEVEGALVAAEKFAKKLGL